jgi:hypothetical protein
VSHLSFRRFDRRFWTRQVRFGAWAAAVALVPAADLTGHSTAAFAGLVALLWLLRTTPADAIRLKRSTSEIILIAAAVAVAGVHWHTLRVLGGTLLLLMFLRLTRRSPWWAVIFCCNPAVPAGGFASAVLAAAAVMVPAVALTGLTASVWQSHLLIILAAVIDLAWSSRRGRRRRSPVPF